MPRLHKNKIPSAGILTQSSCKLICEKNLADGMAVNYPFNHTG